MPFGVLLERCFLVHRLSVDPYYRKAVGQVFVGWSFSSSSPIPYPLEGSGGGDPEDIAPTSGESISNPPAVSGNGPETATIPDLSAPAPRNRALSPSPSPYMEIDSGPYQLTRRAPAPPESPAELSIIGVTTVASPVPGPAVAPQF